MIAELLKKNQGNVQLVVSATDLRELVNEWCDEREAQKEAVRKSMTESERISSFDAGKTLGVTSATLWRWAKSGYLVPIKVGRKNVYLKSDIDRILKSK